MAEMKIPPTTHHAASQRVVTALESGTIPWVRPWGDAEPGLPRNGVTGQTYSGVNVPLLWLTQQEQGYASNEWYTFAQARLLGGQVRPGERGTRVMFGREGVLEREASDGTPRAERFDLTQAFTVFNRSQIDGLPPVEQVNVILLDEDRFTAANEVFAQARVNLVEGSSHDLIRTYMAGHGIAWPTVPPYRRDDDTIELPPLHRAASPDAYYSAMMHELVHATQHESRLNREPPGALGTHSHLREELIAELGGASACAELGIKYEVRHPELVGAWAEMLTQDPKALTNAAAQAARAVEHMKVRDIAKPNVEITTDVDLACAHDLTTLNPLQTAWQMQADVHDVQAMPHGLTLDTIPKANAQVIGDRLDAMLTGAAHERHQAIGWMMAEANQRAARALPSVVSPTQREALVATQVSRACRTQDPEHVKAHLDESLTRVFDRTQAAYAEAMALYTSQSAATSAAPTRDTKAIGQSMKESLDAYNQPHEPGRDR